MKLVTLVSLVGNSRPGLLKELVEHSHNIGATWLNSKVSYLGGQVSALIRVEVARDNAEKLHQIFETCEGIDVRFSDVAETNPDKSARLKFSVDAGDRPGLVSELTQLFDQQGIEVVDLESHRMGVTDLGLNMFTADITLNLPADVSQDAITSDIESISKGMVVREAVPV
ncbi:glycine cleavage system protein R [Corallincola platygyrae]|uniref:Glycine cleavage system transcriptional repressor n=1 Tax=Corallincola platygyrae TaxID=1193278 RepID=A0ABW4XHW3_9GAMM